MTNAFPWVTKTQLEAQCKELGLASGNVVMVHASMRSVGPILGGPDVLIDAILEAVSPEGTIMVYVGCQQPFDDIGRRIYLPEEEVFILEHCPAFNSDAARASRDFGVFAELFRTRTGAVASQNVSARMAALGANASWLVSNHSLSYGFGKGSPLEKLCELDGKILLVGSDLDCVTLLHYAEAISAISEKNVVHIKVPLTIAGERQWTEVEEYNSSTGVRDWPHRFFADIMQKFVNTPNVNVGKLANAITYAMSARKVVDFAVPIMETTAKKLDAQA